MLRLVKKFENIIKKINSSNKTNRFKKYDSLINSQYALPSNYSISTISDYLLGEIAQAINDGTIIEERLLDTKDRLRDHLLLRVDQHSAATEKKLNSDIRVLSLHRLNSSSDLLSKIHSEIRRRFSADIGSPFVIVNSRMWITLPRSSRHGPNAFHTDGFEPGHLKCMIYVSPLSCESGYLVLKNQGEDHEILNLPAGTAILFKNSEIIHSGIPGTCQPRISIEVTLMRSTVNCDQLWAGHFYGRHLREPTLFHYIDPFLEAKRDFLDVAGIKFRKKTEYWKWSPEVERMGLFR